MKYYAKNIHWGLLVYLVLVFVLRDDFDNPLARLFLVIGFISVFTFPVAKGFLENFSRRYYSKEYWTKGFYTETPMKNGIYAMYYMFVFFMSIPICIITFIILVLKRMATK